MTVHPAIILALRTQARALDSVADALEAAAVASDVVDVKQAAAIARCTPRSVRAAIKAGKLAARGTGRHVVIARSDLDAWLAALPPRAVTVERDDEEDEAEIDALADEILGAAE